jgi:pyruvate,water dikinase
MSDDQTTWEPPEPGVWFYSAEHLPGPVSTLFATIAPPLFHGWAVGAARYGMPPNPARFGGINRFLCYTPGEVRAAEVDLDELERAARHSLDTERWRADLRTWADETRPTVVAASRALLAVDLPALDDSALADHLEAAVAHLQRWGPEHFALTYVQGTAGGVLMEAAEGWGLDRMELFESLAGTASATASADALLGRIAAGLRAAGRSTVDDLDEVRALGGDVEDALDELLTDYAWRSLGTDVTPTLAEQPETLVAMLRVALRRSGPRARPDVGRLGRLRAEVPEPDRKRFDDLVAVAQVAYGFNDDNTVVLMAVPIGIVRRAVLEVGRRLVERGRIADRDDAFEATPDDLRVLLLQGEGPTAATLAGRREERIAAAALRPPPMIGEPLPSEPLELPDACRRLAALRDAWWAVGSSRRGADRAAATVGTEVVRGRALVSNDPVEAIQRVEPGDVLVTATTHASYNVLFPLVSAVATEEGGAMSHPAILARELGITAVIGVPGLLDRVQDGDQVEVDPLAGTITVIDPST